MVEFNSKIVVTKLSTCKYSDIFTLLLLELFLLLTILLESWFNNYAHCNRGFELITRKIFRVGRY